MRVISKAGRVVAGVALLSGTLLIGRLALPGRALACYCVPPDSVAEYVTEVDVVIVTGTVVALEGSNGQFGIERVFKGPIVGPAMPIVQDAGSSCSFGMEAGSRLFIAAHVKNGRLMPNVCMSHARLGTAAADALIADAEAVYGAAQGPPEASDAPVDAAGQPTSPAISSRDLALPIILAGLLIAVVLLFATVAILVRRRRPVA